MKKLVVNADDFGLAESVNRAIIECFSEGILTSASLMANGDSFDHAVELSKQNPALAVGIHLVLVEEKPILPSSEIPTLVSKDQKLHKKYPNFLKNFIIGKVNIKDVEKELRAQIEKTLKTKINISHIDSHQHLHMYPSILNLVVSLTKEYKIKWLRNSYDGSLPTSLGQAGLAFLAKKGKRKILHSKISTSDYFLGAGSSGNLTESDILKAFGRMGDGISELMCHPGEDDQVLAKKYSHWNFKWAQEKKALLSNKVKSFLKDRGIELTSYKTL